MPSVVVSDCSEEPVVSHEDDEHGTMSPTGLLANGHDDSDRAWSSWSAESGADSSLTPARSSSPGDELSINNLLAVRRLSDCSSSSSLATLDMEPYCPSQAGEEISDLMETRRDSSPCDDVTAHEDKESVTSDSPEPEFPRKAVHNKVTITFRSF